MSAMVASSLSPERCETTLVQPARCAIVTASIASDRLPIWFTLQSKELAAFSSMARCTFSTFVTSRSSPTIWTRSPMRATSLAQPSQSFWSRPSSSEMMGYLATHSA